MKSKVPKCKECDNYKYGQALTKSTGSIDTDYLKNYHYCAMGKNNYPVIKATELRTSPMWCSKRTK